MDGEVLKVAQALGWPDRSLSTELQASVLSL